MKVIVYGLIVAVLALSVTVGLQFNAIATARSQGRIEYLNSWHKVICRIEGTELANPKATVAVKEKTINYWDNTLRSIGAPTCNL